MAQATSEELKLITQFKSKIFDLWPKFNEVERTNQWLLTWIRAREGNIEKAEEMLRKSLKWRVEHDFDNAINRVIPEHMKKGFPYLISGLTEEKCPVLFVPFGEWDLKKLVESEGGAEKFEQYTGNMFAKILQLQKENSQLPDHLITQFVSVLDFNGYSFMQLSSTKCIRAILKLIQEFEDNVPESLRVGFVINAPKIFSILFALVKPLLSARTLAKVEIYGANKNLWQPKLGEIIPKNIIPIKYGGTRKDLETNCFSNTAQVNDSLTTLVVPPGKKVELDFKVAEKNTSLSWIYKVKDYDIGFSVMLNGKEVYGYEKTESGSENQDGLINCDQIGTYKVIFDNSYSRIRSKTVLYAAQVIPQASSDNILL